MRTIILKKLKEKIELLDKCKITRFGRGVLTTLVFAFIYAAATAQSAQQAATPVIWLRGDLGTVSPLLWADWRGEQWGAATITGKGPTVAGRFNFNKAFVFDGTDNYLKVPYSLEKLPAFTMIAVYHPADTTERGIWGAEKALARKVALTTKNATGPDNMVDTFNPQERVPVLNTVIQNWSETPEVGDSTYLVLGSAGTAQGKFPFKGTIAEFMVFDRALSFLERLQVETYLAIKYGIPLPNSNYVSSFEEVLWHGENNSVYSTRIAGIGRDDAFSLYQKQSASGHDTTKLLTISAGTLAPSNAENQSHINNKDFLLWGDNNLELSGQAGQGADTLLSVIGRKWLMDVTGPTVHQVGTEVQLNLKGLPASTLGYWLVVDRSGSGDFSADRLEYVLPDSVSADSIAFYSNIKWDNDQSGTDNFGFARAKRMLAVINNLAQPGCLVPDGGSANLTVIGGRAPYTYELKNSVTGLSQKWEDNGTSNPKSLTAGDYTLQITDADQTKVIRTFSLYMPDALLVDLGKDLHLGKGEKLTLDATVHIPDSVAVSYKWESNYGFSSTDGRARITEPGEYKVTVTNSQGCAFTDEIKIIGPDAQNFKVYPNFVSSGNSYNVGVSLEQPAGVSVKIYDLKGNLLQSVYGEGRSEYHFKLPAKNRGMYMVVLQTPNGLKSEKIIVY